MEEMHREESGLIEADASELIAGEGKLRACESYVFEPAPDEAKLGYLFIVGETIDKNGTGRELLELVSQAMQQEYYRDPGRSVVSSFEAALHQANLILFDMSEQGLREWMGCFHVSVAALAASQLHICTAGDAESYLVRGNKVILLSEDLSHSPITNPLRTFAQVASGDVTSRDTVFLGTSFFGEAFRNEDLSRFAVERSAETISTRLQQLFSDQGLTEPLAAIVAVLSGSRVTIKPPRAPQAVADESLNQRRPARASAASLSLRQPLQIRRTLLQSVLAIIAKSVAFSWRWMKSRLWPGIVAGSSYGGRWVKQASMAGGRGVISIADISLRRKPVEQEEITATEVLPPSTPKARLQLPRIGNLKTTAVNVLRKTVYYTVNFFVNMPRTSRIFAVLALVMAIALAGSVGLLKQKRAEDGEIQRASEILHDARTKFEAAETALIYDNREKTKSLLNEASSGIASLREMDLYTEEATTLERKVSGVMDKLQKVTRASTSEVKTVGDFGTQPSLKKLTDIVLIDGSFYTFAPSTNEIYAMSSSGEVSAVSEDTEGIGFLKYGLAHDADKSIIFLTDAPGVALFDTKDKNLSQQEIAFSSPEADITGAAVFGNRLYVYDSSEKNIYMYSKSLRGYTGATVWQSDGEFNREGIVSLAVDGSIYTLHSDGSVNELFKGERVDFKLEEVEPSLRGAKSIYTGEEYYNIYVTDPSNKRVAVFDKKGNLQQQVLVDVASNFADAAVAPDEKTVYVLDGTRVLAVPIVR